MLSAKCCARTQSVNLELKLDYCRDQHHFTDGAAVGDAVGDEVGAEVEPGDVIMAITHEFALIDPHISCKIIHFPEINNLFPGINDSFSGNK